MKDIVKYMTKREKIATGIMLYLATLCVVLMLSLSMSGCDTESECIVGQWSGDNVTMHFSETGSVTFEQVSVQSDGSVSSSYNVSGTWELYGGGIVLKWTPIGWPEDDVFARYEINHETLTIAPFSASVYYVLQKQN
jgi:hypothetical protein